MGEGYLLHLLERLPEGVTEIYSHPTLEADAIPEDGRPTPGHHSRRDFEALTSPLVAEAIRSGAIELI
jgi:hypothetical protein